MATLLTFKGITIEAPEITASIKRELAVAWLIRQKLDNLQAPDSITEPEIVSIIAEIDTQETERLDLVDLGRQVAAELAWLDTTIAGIDAYTAAQVRDVVKRLCRENRDIFKALRCVVRKLAN